MQKSILSFLKASLEFIKYLSRAYTQSVINTSAFKRFCDLFNDNKNSEEPEEFKKLIETLFILLSVAMLFAIILFSINIISYEPADNGGGLGAFGDFLGGVLNPILTFLTFFGLIITIVIQRKELHLARVEFEKSANALTDQSKSLKQQNVENTFFNLIELHNNICKELTLAHLIDNRMDKHHGALAEEHSDFTNTLAKGREVFTIIKEKFDEDGFPTSDDMKNKYDEFQKSRNNIVSHYFRNLYQILKFVDESNIDNSNKKKYIRIIRSQLSTDELTILYFNCLSPLVDNGQFLELVRKHAILEHINFTCDRERNIPVSLQDIEKYVGVGTQIGSNGAFGTNSFIKHFLESNNSDVEVFISI
jgi:hypothetical protein